MIRDAFALVLLLSAAFAVQNPFSYEGRYLIGTTSYALEMPMSLDEGATINQRYVVHLLPEMYVDGNKVDLVGFSIIPATGSETFRPADSYFFRTMNTANDIEVTSEIRVSDDRIEAKTTALNRGQSSVEISMVSNISSPYNFTVFDPSKYTGRDTSYIVITPEGGEGASLGVIYPGVNIMTESPNFHRTDLHKITLGNPELKPSAAMTVTAIYYPMSIQRQREGAVHLDKLDYVYQKTFQTRGDIGSVDSLLSLEKKYAGSKLEPFRNMRAIDLHSKVENRLQAAAHYDEACEALGEICKVVIADYEGDNYAWVEYFSGGEWKRGALYDGVPSYAKTIYEEPAAKLVELPETGERDRSYYEATSFLMDINKSEALMYFALIIVAAIVIIVVIHFKAKSIMSADRRVSATARIDPNGDYEILGEERFDDPMLDELMRIVRDKKGRVSVREIENETRYSPELVSFGIQYLSERGLIRKKDAPYQAPQAIRMAAKPKEGFDAFIRRVAKGGFKAQEPLKKQKKD